MTAIDPSAVEAALRRLLAEVGRLRADPAGLAGTDDLYAAGLSSLATVDLMLAVEDHFGIEFTNEWLNRRTFASVAALGRAVQSLREAAP